MILLDFSAVMHQCIFSAISTIKPKEIDGQYKTEDFIQYAKYRILEEILNVQNEFVSYGDTVICLDDHSKKNWRKEIYSDYKNSRKAFREKSPSFAWILVIVLASGRLPPFSRTEMT